MEPVKYQQLSKFLSGAKTSGYPQAVLIFGENYLVEKSLETICDSILDSPDSRFAKESFQGGAVSMADILDQLLTLSFLAPKKLVIVKQAPLFTQSTSPGQINFTSTDIERLSDVIAKKLPESHTVIFTTPNADKRKKIYKSFLENGLIIDCSVSSGTRKADMDEQQAVLKSVADQMLAKAGKKIDSQAFRQLLELTGFHLDILSQNIEKLTSYAGSRGTILLSDVQAIVRRDKKDPIFNLTNAFMDKDVKKCLQVFHSLLDEGYHLLQILKSFENAVRKLLAVKCGIDRICLQFNLSLRGMGFNTFRSSVMPMIRDYDNQVRADAETLALDLNLQDKSGVKKSGIKDLLLAPNPKSPYPVYQTILKTLNFSREELVEALMQLSRLDLKMKSTSSDAKTGLEQFIIKNCSTGGAGHAAENKDRRHNI